MPRFITLCFSIFKGKIKMTFGEIDQHSHKFWLFHIRDWNKKNLEETLLFIDFSRAYDFIHREKMEKVQLVYSLFKETVTTFMMLYKITNAVARSPDVETDFIYIVAGDVQRDILVPYTLMIQLNNLLVTSLHLIKENGFILRKTVSRRHSTATMTNADFEDDIALLANTGWNDKIVVLKKTTLQLYFKTFIEKINSGNLIM